jgi:hypothetical protein
MTFSSGLREWTDSDGAAFILASTLGVIKSDASFAESKWIFWTDNPLGNGLYAALIALADAGVLESRDGEAFRWKYDSSVEGQPSHQ